ncbi:MAG: arginine repressor [Clostridia bacterium]|nr:arginine repressor [Clostridia bacterium]
MKNRRHQKIREIIENKNIETQFQLTDELRSHGFNVTQATISRDIKELGLIKVVAGENNFRYSFPSGVVVGNNFDRAKRMFRDNVLKVSYSENLVVIKTLPGIASGVASCVDGLGWSELIGSVAGDDTVFVLIRDKKDVQPVSERLQSLTQ